MGNGTIPLDQLVFVGNDVDGVPAYLAPGAAGDFNALRAAALAETGVRLQISGGGGAYRTLAQQQYYYNEYINNGGANAAYPGTSNHGWGKAVDIWNWSAVYGWLLRNCGRWGFENNYAPEGWHYQHLADISIAGWIIEGDEVDMASLAELKALIGDIVRRENRRRLYYDIDEKRYYSIDWDLPTGDPAKIAYPKNDQQILSLHSNYQVSGDSKDQAKQLPHENILTLLRIADGTDQVFTPPQ